MCPVESGHEAFCGGIRRLGASEHELPGAHGVPRPRAGPAYGGTSTPAREARHSNRLSGVDHEPGKVTCHVY